jgi:hypothetical protein
MILDMHGDGGAYIMFNLILFLGIPLGGPLGMLFVDRVIFKSTTHYVWRIVTGSLMGVLGSAFVYWVLPLCGVDFDAWFPPISDIYLTWGIESFFLISVFFSLIGYNAIGLLKRDMKKPPTKNNN